LGSFKSVAFCCNANFASLPFLGSHNQYGFAEKQLMNIILKRLKGKRIAIIGAGYLAGTFYFEVNQVVG
jgi:hypothetical protein